jgi:hypothetical protein
MKLLFIENRYATWLNEAVARELAVDGHTVHWIVQNPVFTPTVGRVHIIPFPQHADLQPPGDEPVFAKLRLSDRGVRHFGVSCEHHAYYLRETRRVFDDIVPDVVFGESTQLHEILAIEEARARQIPYLFPTATRYPPGRMCFLAYDSMDTVAGSGDDLPVDQAETMIKAINQRTLIPSYMASSPSSKISTMATTVWDRLRISYGWWKGERYVTPSPWRKMALDRAQVRLRKRWNTLARAHGPAKRPYVLYALQMQPESTIDVWGLPWNDQAEIVRRAARALDPLGYDLVVKPNPKSKYEINERLCDAADTEHNLVPVPHGVPMQGLFEPAKAILSVTGTVLIEAVFAGKPALSLGSHAMARFEGITHLDSPEDIVQHLTAQEASDASTSAIRLLTRLHRSSYPAEVVDPFLQRERITRTSVLSLTDAFRHVLRFSSRTLQVPVPQAIAQPISHDN